MRVIAGFFAVSVIAIVSVIPARAEVVSTELLDKRLGTEGNLATVAHTGSYNDLANKPTIPAAANNATLDIQKNGTSVGTFTANASTNKTINITVPTGALASKNTVTSAEITDGTITNADINASAGIKKTQLDATVQASLDKADTALQEHQDISEKEDKPNKVKSTEDLTSLKSSETRYPSMAAANKLAQVQAQAAVAGAASSYQVKSSGDYQMGKAGGGWTTMSADQQNALNSGVTSAKVATYDGYATGKQDALTAGAYITITKDASTGKTTIASTGPTYTLPAATSGALGGVKSGGNITVGTDGAVTVEQAKNATNATNATKATQDASGNVITATYATKTELTNGLAGKQGTLKAGSNISIAADGTISATDTNTTYGAAGTGLGLVKSGGVATVSGGQITAVSKATNADNATNATNATTATNAKKICSGSTCTAFVDIWVE